MVIFLAPDANLKYFDPGGPVLFDYLGYGHAQTAYRTRDEVDYSDIRQNRRGSVHTLSK
jgi:hypothetical protein